MILDSNVTIVDVAFNLSGSLAGIPAVLDQLPVSPRIGFDDMPTLEEDTSRVDQTWTPDLARLEVDLSVPVYNEAAVRKAPYTSNVAQIDSMVGFYDWINDLLRDW